MACRDGDCAYNMRGAALPSQRGTTDLKMTLDQLAMNLELSQRTVSRALNGKDRMAKASRGGGSPRSIMVPVALPLGATTTSAAAGA